MTYRRSTYLALIATLLVAFSSQAVSAPRKKTPAKKTSALVELSLAFVSYTRGESDEAANRIQRHLKQIKTHGAPADIMDSFKRSGELYREMGMVDQARMCFETAISISEQVGKPIASLDRLQEPKGTRKTM